jgi:hypothetical protein
MDRKEALEFLELPEFATPIEIKERLESKLAYFELLSEKAPSQFVRRLHARNVARVKEIIVASKSWPAAAAPVLTEMPPIPEMIEDAGAAEPAAPERPAEPEKAPEPEKPAAAPAEPEKSKEPEKVAAAPAKPRAEERPAAPAKPVLAPAKPAEKEPVAWLIRHTENQSPVSFPLYPGKNYLGRKEKPGAQPFVKVAEDPYISKVHAVIIVEPGAGHAFFLADDPATNGDKASTNGTYINGMEDRITTKTRIRNNDTIQIGITKLILRYNDSGLEDIVREVEQKNYMHTVVIDAL